jgi:hypothetical protein
MIRFTFTIVAIAILFCVCSAHALAQLPHYYVLRNNRATIGHPYTSTVTPVARQSYAYGYFGAQPSRYHTVESGYYRSYTRYSHYGPW